MDILKVIFLWVLFCSINASIVALLIIVIRAAFKNRIVPRVLCLLWLLVIVKLITAPITAQSQIGVFHLFNYEQISSNVPDTATDCQPVTDFSDLKNVEANKPLNNAADISGQTSEKTDSGYHIQESVSTGNLLKNIKSNENAAYEEEKTNIDGLDATFITVHTKHQVNQKDVNFIIMDTVKHLVWQDHNTWYNLEYSVSSKGLNGLPVVYEHMSRDELNKIVASMRVPKDIKHVSYTSEIFGNFFAIYNKADLKDAEQLLGFNKNIRLETKRYLLYS